MLVLVLVLVLEPPADLNRAPPSARLDLDVGAGWRDDTATRALTDVTASGAAVSDLGARAAWFPAAHLGAAAGLRAGRFTLTPARGVVLPDHADERSLFASGGVAARGFASRLTVEGSLGYGYLRLPAMFVTAGPAGDARFAGGSLRGHGPHLAAALRLSLTARWGLELAGEALPVIWGARYGDTAVEPRWFAARGAAVVDCFTLGRTRWSLLASYELARTRATGGAARLTQKEQQLGLGLRATLLPPSPRPSPSPGATAPPPPPRPVLPLPAALSGVVRTQDHGSAVAWVSITELGLVVRADEQGSFRFDVAPGRYTLTIEAEGYLPQSKVITVGPGEQHIYNLELQREPP